MLAVVEACAGVEAAVVAGLVVADGLVVSAFDGGDVEAMDDVVDDCTGTAAGVVV